MKVELTPGQIAALLDAIWLAQHEYAGWCSEEWGYADEHLITEHCKHKSRAYNELSDVIDILNQATAEVQSW